MNPSRATSNPSVHCLRQVVTLVAFVSIALVSATPGRAQCGDRIGNADFSPSNAPRLALTAATISGTDELLASFSDAASGRDLSVMRFDRASSTWVYLGSPGFVDLGTDVNNVPTIQLTEGGLALVAASDNADGGRAKLFLHDSADGWLPLGSRGAGDAPTIDPAFALTPNLGVVMAFGEQGVGARAYTYDGADGVYLDLANGPIATGETKDFSVEYEEATGVFFIAFLQRSGGGDFQVRVQRFDANGFQEVGNPGALFTAPGGTFSANDLKMALGADGLPIIAFADATIGGRITVARFDGSTWNVVGTRGVSDRVSSDADIAFRDGRLYIGYIDQEPSRPTPQARYFDGSRWVEACEGASSLGVGYWGTLAATENNLYLGFVNLANERANVVSVPIEVNVQAGIATFDGTELNCSNPMLTLDGSVSSGAPNLTYAWSTGATTPSIVVSAPGTYRLIVSDQATGTRDTASVTITEVILVVTVDATVTELSDAQPTAILTAEASGSPANPAFAYRWSTGETTKMITVAAAATYTVTIDFLEPDDMFVLCSGQASRTITDSRGSGGNPNCARIVASATELNCQTPIVTLDAAPSLGGDSGPATYLWSTGATSSSISVTAPGTYAVIVNAPSIGCRDTTTIAITQVGGNPPVVLIVAPDGSSLDCGSTSVVLDGSDSSGDGPLTYAWSNGSTDPIIEVTAAGTYTLTVTDIETGCSASGTFTVTGMNPGLLAAGFLVNAEVCAGDSLHLIDYSVLEAMATADFSWDFGDGNTSSERDPVHRYATPGRYIVNLEVSSGGCPPELVSKPLTVVQCLRRDAASGVVASLTPTLTRGPVTLDVELPAVGEVHVSVLNAQGQLRSSQNLGSAQRFREELVLPGPGQYFVQLRSAYGNSVLRAVVVE